MFARLEESIYKGDTRQTAPVPEFDVVRIQKPHVLIVSVVLLCASLIPAANRTLRWVGNVNEIVLLASIPEDQHSFNPWYWDSYLVSPDMVVWLLANFDWPYRERATWLGAPLHMAITGRVGQHLSGEDRGRLLRLLKVLIERGEPINEYNASDIRFTPLQLAVFHCDKDAVELLVDSGAILDLPIRPKPDSQIDALDGMDAVELANYMQPRDEYCHDDIHGYLVSNLEGS